MPQELKELISSYQSQREAGRGPAICSSIISTARQCNMDKDCALPPDEADTKEMAVDARDLIVGNVYRKCATGTAATIGKWHSQSLFTRQQSIYRCSEARVKTLSISCSSPRLFQAACGEAAVVMPWLLPYSISGHTVPVHR